MEKTKFVNLVKLIIEEVDNEIGGRWLSTEICLTNKEARKAIKKEVKECFREIIEEVKEKEKIKLIRENLGIDK